MMMKPKITIMVTKENYRKYTKTKLNNKISVSISALRIILIPASKVMVRNTMMVYTMMKLTIIHKINHWKGNTMMMEVKMNI
jgi:hypothetical protein